MHFDFAFFLTLATFVTGLIWLVDRWAFAPARQRRAEAAREAARSDAEREEAERLGGESTLVEYSRSLFPVILAVLVLRSFVVEPFHIPSGSMMPTLLEGDFILVNKFAYGLRLPVLDSEILETGEPQRGDVIVFRFPRNPRENYIKRVVGVPGDKIAYYDKMLYINGERQDQIELGRYRPADAGPMGGADLRLERLAGSHHRILIDPRSGTAEGEYTVPDGQYFVMGDNRDHSNDSRYWGTVSEANLVGKAFVIWMSFDTANGGVHWSRIGDGID